MRTPYVSRPPPPLAVCPDPPALQALWKRKISVLRRMGQIGRAVDELSAFLDTFYTDVEGWLELADMYSACNQYVPSPPPFLFFADPGCGTPVRRYANALQSMQHALLLAPQNSFYVLQTAETAYTAGDIPLAIRMYLTVVDMSDSDSDPPMDSIPEGITVRGWYGVKLVSLHKRCVVNVEMWSGPSLETFQCARRLLRDPRTASQSPSQTPAPEHVKLLDELATERLLTAYSSGNGPVNGREALVKWLEVK